MMTIEEKRLKENERSKKKYYAHREKRLAKIHEYQKNNKEKRKQTCKSWLDRNKEKSKEYRERYNKKYPEKVGKFSEKQIEKRNLTSKVWYELNKNRIKEIRKVNYKKWVKNNPNKIKYYHVSRKKHILERTPSWLNDMDYKIMEAIYDLTNALNNYSNVVYQVDHIAPLKGKEISGLHVPNNLQIISGIDNMIKGNRFDINQN